MARVRQYLVALAGVAALGSGCSSSGSAPSVPRARSLSSESPAGTAASPAPTGEVQAYLDAVNALCDEMLPKIIHVTHGGSVDVPVDDFLASWPAHDRLHRWFDARLARIPVPPVAHEEAAAFAAYVRFANRLNAARLAAAHQGQAAYSREMLAEADAANDPTITARTAAGFHESCSAR